jgi:rhodanese-related sulfurtransferase
MQSLESLTPREAYAAYILGSSVLVDVREPSEFKNKAVGVNKQVNLPFSELDKRYEELPENKQVVLVSNAGYKSKQAARFLMAHGYERVATMDGGISAWEEEGLPLR